MSSNSNQNKNGSSFYTILFIGFILLILVTCGSRHRVGCHCFDGTESSATGQGACSHHGGVMYWQYKYWWND